jgi:hypothetical protein
MDSDALERRLAAIEVRLDKLEAGRARRAPAAAPAPHDEPAVINYTLIGKSVLMIGGAYVLRALTELGALNERAGVILGFFYALAWIGVAGRALARGRRTVALFDAGTAALIASSLVWESTSRFHALTPPVAAAMIVIASFALLVVARVRHDSVLAMFAAGMTGITCIGLTIATGAILPQLVAIAVVAIAIVIEGMWPSYLALALTIASGGVAVPMIFLGGGATAAAIVLSVLLAVMFALAILRRDPLLLIGAGWAGLIASLLAIQPWALPLLWSAAALMCAAIGRRWSAVSVPASLWCIAAGVACVASPKALPVVAVVAAISLTMTRRELAPVSRFVFLAVATIAAIASAFVFLPETTPMIRTAIIALAAVALSLLPIPEGSVIARVLLAIGGLKLLLDDLRAGQATAIVVALALYGGAMVIVARRRRQAVTV